MAAGGEVVMDTGKVVGSAQLRSQGALLQHGSVLLSDDQSRVREITSGQSVSADVRPLSLVLARDVSWEEVALAISDAARVWPANWDEFEDELHLLAEAEVAAPRFRDPEWTWRR
jgi:lipoate-protein ligase A